MKKLIIIATVALAAIASNAAEVNWKWTSTLYDHANSDSAFKGTVYIINANSYSQQTVLTAILDGGSLESYKMSSQNTANGKAAATAVTIKDTANFEPVRTSGSDNFADYYYAALTTDTEGNNWVFLGNTQSKVVDTVLDTTLSSSLSASKVGFESDTFSAQGWYKAESVPEPTSGLLLLLGVAGLALRRRRA